MSKPLKKLLRAGILTGIAATAALVILNMYVHRKYVHDIKDNDALLPNAPVAIVFGAGINGKQPTKYLRDRLDAGIALYKAGKVPKLLLTGDNGTHQHDEISVMKKYCVSNGIPKQDLYLDYAGFDTYSSLYRAQYIFEVNKAILISQKYHLFRAMYIADKLGIQAVGYDANKGKYALQKKNQLREYAATAKAALNLLFHRKPKFLGEKVPINGPSNYDLE